MSLTIRYDLSNPFYDQSLASTPSYRNETHHVTAT